MPKSAPNPQVPTLPLQHPHRSAHRPQWRSVRRSMCKLSSCKCRELDLRELCRAWFCRRNCPDASIQPTRKACLPSLQAKAWWNFPRRLASKIQAFIERLGSSWQCRRRPDTFWGQSWRSFLTKGLVDTSSQLSQLRMQSVHRRRGPN